MQLMTMHGSKGLEYKMVILPDVNEGNIPQKKAKEDREIEEERRMLYVGMTRARKCLILSYVKGDKDNSRMPSRFLRPVMELFE